MHTQKRKKNKIYQSVVFKVILAVVILICTILTVGEITDLPGFPNWGQLEESVGKIEDKISVPGYLQMHVIDVGQGDSILIRCGKKNVLIDAGDNGKGSIVLSYLERLGITHLDWIIATHPDSDHIGGMDEVLNADISVDHFMMPRMPESLTPTTKTYEALLSAVSAKGLKITQPIAGVRYFLDDGVMMVLSPGGEYSSANDYSVVCKFTFKQTSFLLTGDAEAAAENDMLKDFDNDVKADVIKLGHHGSGSSSSDKFLQKVDPEYAVISVGKDNKYNHPADKALLKLKAMHIEYYRTDFSGDVIFTSDGQKVQVIQNK